MGLSHRWITKEFDLDQLSPPIAFEESGEALKFEPWDDYLEFLVKKTMDYFGNDQIRARNAYYYKGILIQCIGENAIRGRATVHLYGKTGALVEQRHFDIPQRG